MVTYSRRFGRIRNPILGAVAVLILLLQSVAGSAYYSMVMQNYASVSSPPVILEEGIAGNSTIYTNKTSAKVSVAAPVWLGDWDERVKITIDNNDVDSGLSNFPVLVYLSNSSGRNNDDVTFVFDEVGSNSKKIAVTTSDGTTQCYVEIERWDNASEQAWLWVKVPSISSTADTDLYLYYDSSKSDNTAYVGDKESNPAQNVWDTNFKGVWHLDEDPSGTAPQMKDSTSNNNNGTSYGNMTSGDQVAGKIDGSLDFDGNDDYIQTTSSELKTLNNFTLSVWFKADSTTAPQHILWEGPASQNGWGDGSGNPNSHEMHLTVCKFDVNNTLIFFYGYEESGGVWAPAVEINMSFSDTTNWNHAVVVMTGAGTSPSAELFLNGVSQGTDTGTQTNRTAWDTNLRIGRPGANQRYFDGMIDEVRILETARSAGWIKASYESGRDDLLDFGSEERNIDYVDNNTSNVGSPTDRGTHSDFSAQQAGPDSIYDTLTEENTGDVSNTTLIDAESFEGTWPPTGWSENPSDSRWNKESDQAYDGTYSANFDGPFFGSSSGDLDTPDLDCSDADAIYVDFWYRDHLLDAGEFLLRYYDGSNWDTISDLGSTTQEDEWLHYQEKITDSQYFVSTFKVRWSAVSVDSGENIWVDLVTVKKEVQTYDYKLDLEVQWTNADYDETNEELAIYFDKGNNTHSLDATGGYMIIDDGTPDWGSTTGTISFWIKMDTSVQGRFWGQDGNMETRWSGTNLLLDWGATSSMTSAYPFSADTWYFVAIVWDENNNNLFLYIGDENNPPTLDANSLSGTWTSTTPPPTENRFMNGLGGNEPVDGHGDDLRYWDTDRTLAEIQSDYNTELTGSETSLRSYFKLNNNFDDVGPDDNDGYGSVGYSFSSDVPFLNGTPTENIRVDVWNGTAWQNLFTDLTNGWNHVSVSSYLTSSNFTIRFNGGNENGDTTQDSWYIDATLLNVWTNESTYDYVLQVVNQVEDNWTINLQVYESPNINRLLKTTISFHDGNSSDQIIVNYGAITQPKGPTYNLPGGVNSTIYISMSNLQAITTGTSYLYVHLKLLVPNTSTYLLYVITFEIT